MMVDDSHPNGGEFFEWLDTAEITPEELAVCFVGLLNVLKAETYEGNERFIVHVGQLASKHHGVQLEHIAHSVRFLTKGDPA